MPALAGEGDGDGNVVTLTSKNFDSLTAEGQWLVKFYAPWCGHCKHIAPIYEEAATALLGKMSFGEVDATANGVLKTRFGITGYPTIKFMRDGTVQEYNYPRTVEGFVGFAERMNGPAVHRLGTLSRVQAFTRDPEHPVTFIFAKPEDGASSRAEYEVFSQVARSLQSSQFFAETRAVEFTKSFPPHEAPFVVKVEDGEEPVILTDLRDAADVKQWVLDNKFQVVTEITSMNFRDLSDSQRLLAIGVIDPSNNSANKPFLQAVRRLARPNESPLTDHVRSSFVFCTLDGVRWDKFVEQFNIKQEELPRLFVLDAQNKKFFEDVEVDELDEMETFLSDVVVGKVPAQREGLWGLPQRLWRRFMEWYPTSAVLAAGLVLVLGLGAWYGARSSVEAEKPHGD